MCHRQSFSPSVLRLPRWSTKKAHHPWNLLFIIFLIITQQATNSAGGCIQNLSATRQNAPSNLFYLPLLHLLLLSLFVNRLSAIVSLPFFAAFHLSLSIQCFSCTRVSLSVAVPLSVVVPVAVRSLSSVPFPIGQRSKGIQSRRSGNGSVKKKKQVNRVRHLFVRRIYPGVVIHPKFRSYLLFPLYWFLHFWPINYIRFYSNIRLSFSRFWSLKIMNEWYH